VLDERAVLVGKSDQPYLAPTVHFGAKTQVGGREFCFSTTPQTDFAMERAIYDDDLAQAWADVRAPSVVCPTHRFSLFFL
jgi:hypothetical protein